MKKIFMTGYAGKDISDLKPLVERLDAMLFDIRFAPFSEVMCWRKVYLKALLGEKYRHIPNLGNRTFRENKITIQNLNLGIETLLNLEMNVVLMCACEKLENCHRRVIAEELLKREIETFELTDWKDINILPQNSSFDRVNKKTTENTAKTEIKLNRR